MNAKIVTANRLNDGIVVYLDAAGDWSESVAQARVAPDQDAARALLAQAEAPEQGVRVVGPYLMDVAVEDGRPRPVSIREVIRALGPSVRLDLGRQAESA